MLTCSSRKHWNWRIYTMWEDCFPGPFMLKSREMAYPAPTKGFLQARPDTAMLFAHFEYTHSPSPAPPFLLTQNLSPKDIAGYDIMKLKVSWWIPASLVGKGIKTILYITTCISLLEAKALGGMAFQKGCYDNCSEKPPNPNSEVIY